MLSVKILSYPLLLILKSVISTGFTNFDKIKNIIKMSDVNKGTLVLSSHPSYLDPVILFLKLYTEFGDRVVPVIGSNMYQDFPRILGSYNPIVLPRFSDGINNVKLDRLQKGISQIKESLSSGKIILIYPSAKMQTSGVEEVGGAWVAHNICKDMPDINKIVVRVDGAWDTELSLKKDKGGLKRTFSIAIKEYLFKFLKKGFSRDSITFNFIDASLKLNKKKSLKVFNKELSSIMNGGVNKVEKVKDSNKCIKNTNIAKLLITEIKKSAKDLKIKNYNAINIHTDLEKDLGMDSIDRAKMLIGVGRSLGISITSVRSGVSEIIEDINTNIFLSQEEVDFICRKIDSSKKSNLSIDFEMIKSSNSLINLFESICKKNRSQTAIIDTKQSFTYDHIYKTSKVISSLINKKYDDSKYIGILLPTSGIALASIFAVLISGKIPVMFSPLDSEKKIAGVIKSLKISYIFSAYAFIDKLNFNIGSAAISKIIYIEEAISKIGIFDIIQSYLMPKRSIRAKENDIAIIFTTSGTSGKLKSVPLTHRNLIENLNSSLSLFVKHNRSLKDIVSFSSLPVSHSYGFVVGMLLPFVSGSKHILYPKILDSISTVSILKRSGAKIAFSIPSLIRSWKDAINDSVKINSLKNIILGAEPLHKEIISECNTIAPKANILVGYGLTECSPVISMGKYIGEENYVGTILNNLKVVIKDKKEEGEILVRGSSVFSGYLNHDNNCFVHQDGHMYLNTKDIGYIKKEKQLFVKGRADSIVKIAGEKVNVVTIKMTIAKELNLKPNEIEVAEHQGKIICFLIKKLSIEKINSVLMKNKIKVKIKKLIVVSDMPMLSSGKTDIIKLKNTHIK